LQYFIKLNIYYIAGNSAGKIKYYLVKAIETNGESSFDLVRLLLSSGASIDERFPEDSTPLMTALIHASRDVVDLMIQRGANTMAIDEEGDLVLHCVAYGRYIDLFAYLKSRGADARLTNARRQTAIHAAICYSEFSGLILNGNYNINISPSYPWSGNGYGHDQLYPWWLDNAKGFKLYSRRLGITRLRKLADLVTIKSLGRSSSSFETVHQSSTPFCVVRCQRSLQRNPQHIFYIGSWLVALRIRKISQTPRGGTTRMGPD